MTEQINCFCQSLYNCTTIKYTESQLYHCKLLASALSEMALVNQYLAVVLGHTGRLLTHSLPDRAAVLLCIRSALSWDGHCLDSPIDVVVC